ncbi:MAG: phosphoglycerate dehydrogenase [Rhodospirillales bacterium]
MRKTVLITTSSFQVDSNEHLRRLGDAGYDIVLNPLGRRLSEAEVGQLIADLEPVGMIAGVEPLTADVIGRASALRVISRCGVGIDSIDLDAAAANGIEVTITPDGPTASVSELTLAMMLAACRRVVEADRRIRNGEWGGLMGRLLAQQTVGLIGYGRIGRAVGRLVAAFGATVVASDPQSGGNHDVPMLSVDELLLRADVVSLHVPLTDETRNLMNADRIAGMKPGSILVNASRGGLVDEAALKQSLDDGHLAAAALDCFADEPYAGPLCECPTVVLTAHMGSYAREARAMMELEAAKNLASVLLD